jgi:hypothetical protein
MIYKEPSKTSINVRDNRLLFDESVSAYFDVNGDKTILELSGLKRAITLWRKI